jgi:hypothetical protein
MVGTDSMGKETEAEVDPGQSVEATVDAEQHGPIVDVAVNVALKTIIMVL